MIELLLIAAIGLHLLVLWKVCERQPINLTVYIDNGGDEPIKVPPTRLEGDEWKDGPVEDAP